MGLERQLKYLLCVSQIPMKYFISKPMLIYRRNEISFRENRFFSFSHIQFFRFIVFPPHLPIYFKIQRNPLYESLLLQNVYPVYFINTVFLFWIGFVMFECSLHSRELLAIRVFYQSIHRHVHAGMLMQARKSSSEVRACRKSKTTTCICILRCLEYSL